MQVHAPLRRHLSFPVLLILFLASLIGSQSVHMQRADAYALSGCRFPFGPINYSFGSIGTTQRNAVIAGATQWSNLTDVTMRQSTAYPTIQATSANFGNTGWDGQAPDFMVCQGGFGGDHTIRLNTYYAQSALTWQSVATHELGHAIGLAHVGSSTTPCTSVSIMNPGTYRRYVQCSKYTPQADDIRGINALY